MKNKPLIINNETLAELITFKSNELKIDANEYDIIPNDEFRQNINPTGKMCPRCQAMEMREIVVVVGKRIKDFNALEANEMASHFFMNSMPQFDKKSVKFIPIVFNCSNCIYYEPIHGWDDFLKREKKLRKELDDE